MKNLPPPPRKPQLDSESNPQINQPRCDYSPGMNLRDIENGGLISFPLLRPSKPEALQLDTSKYCYENERQESGFTPLTNDTRVKFSGRENQIRARRIRRRLRIAPVNNEDTLRLIRNIPFQTLTADPLIYSFYNGTVTFN